jgi:2-oxoglutarate dehydrogenase E1 component
MIQGNKLNNTRSFVACNSHLSEYAVLGFEYGYAITHPMCLVLWEAQFGDFANGAQTMIDQFIASGETKWNVKNGLVLLLPHGYDGQGPEHSSCRIERYLQLTDAVDFPLHDEEEIAKIQQMINMRVCNPSTAANYFHLLRSQVRRPFRKPLVVVSPKKLLKLRQAGSDIEEFGQGLRFRKVIEDQGKNMVDDKKVRRVVFCSG